MTEGLVHGTKLKVGLSTRLFLPLDSLVQYTSSLYMLKERHTIRLPSTDISYEHFQVVCHGLHVYHE